MLILDFSNETKTRVIKKSFEEKTARFYKALKALADKKLYKRNGLIDLVITSDRKIKLMNNEYRQKDSPTDVITFAYLEVTEYKKEEGDIIVADIFISIDTAKRQAKERGHSLMREMEILFVHGLLHAFGFDHNNDRQEKEMEKWAKKILAKK